MAYALHRSLRKQNVDSHFVIAGNKTTDFEQVYGLSEISRIKNLEFLVTKKLDRLLLRKYVNRSVQYFSPGQMGLNLKFLIKKFSPHILHLHWVNDGGLKISSLGDIHIPIVWTLHDQWPMTGGCHYTGLCRGHVTSCGRCPVLGSNQSSDISRAGALAKQQTFKQIHFVAVSEWMKSEANSSKQIKNSKIHMIYNGIETNIFFQKNYVECRQKLNLPAKKKIILFGAHYTEDPRKGIKLLKESLALLPKENRPLLLIFGESIKDNEFEGFEARYMGYVENPTDLAIAYNAADLFISLANQEAFGLTVAEAISCGTRTLVLEGTGASEILKNSKNGFVISPDTHKISQKIIEILLLDRPEKTEPLREFSIEACSESYKQLYSAILSLS